MTPNRIKLAVGQQWRNRDGALVSIEQLDADVVLCWRLSNGHRVNDRGTFWTDGDPCEIDLDVFVSHGPVNTKDTAPATASPAGVGDIHGTAQGSGARFNAGKPAFDLVPLRLVAASLRVVGQRQDSVYALACLGQWQERQDSERLYEALTLLGMGGWPECAQVFAYGAQKYSEWNWARGMAWSIPLACAARHLLALISGEVNDPESGLPHRGHIFCNIAMILTYQQTFLDGDDRAPVGCLAPVLAAA